MQHFPVQRTDRDGHSEPRGCVARPGSGRKHDVVAKDRSGFVSHTDDTLSPADETVRRSGDDPTTAALDCRNGGE